MSRHPLEGCDLSAPHPTAILHDTRAKLARLNPSATWIPQRMLPTRAIRIGLTAVLMFATVGTAPAQEDAPPPAHVSLSVGLFQFDMQGDGWAPLAAVRAAFPLATVLTFEASILGARPGQDLGTTNVLIPEGQFQLTLPFTNVVPYIGLGGGAAFDFRDAVDGGTKTWATFSGSVGIRTFFNDGRIGAQTEYRARGIGGDTGGSSNEYTVGVLFRL